MGCSGRPSVYPVHHRVKSRLASQHYAIRQHYTIQNIIPSFEGTEPTILLGMCTRIGTVHEFGRIATLDSTKLSGPNLQHVLRRRRQRAVLKLCVCIVLALRKRIAVSESESG